jgi:hypothetical protein
MIGSIGLKLRPIKLAFLVHPNDNSGLLQAIQINTFLWGGAYNPIIPCFKRTPPKWQDRLLKVPNSSEIVKGYLEAFDPDFVVPIGECANHSFDIGHRPAISVSEILDSVESEGVTGYGVGLFELLDYLIEKELKFERRKPLLFNFPEVGATHRLFFASVFGALPPRLDELFWEHFAEDLNANKQPCSISNFHEFWIYGNRYLRRISSLFVTSRRLSWLKGNCIFYIDANNTLDIIDYWNLRSIGWSVVPVPRQAAGQDGLKKIVREFIDLNYFPHRFNSTIYHFTTILKGRAIPKEEFDEFVKSLEIPRPENSDQPKFVLQNWYPRIWDEWARDKDDVECCDIEARTSLHDLTSQEGRVSIKALSPKFVLRDNFMGKPRFANEVDIRVYGGNYLLAEVIPEGGKDLLGAIGAWGQSDRWRFSAKGLTFFSEFSDQSIYMALPNAEDLFMAWLKAHGWESKISVPGRIANQMTKQFENEFGLHHLANEGLIKLLGGKMREGKPLNKDEFWAEMSKIANQKKMGAYGNPSAIIYSLTDIQMFRLGIEIQCPTCSMRSWFSIKDADYELQCPKCLENFSIRAFDPHDLVWAYRTFGPFSLPNQASGVYTVLLTLRFFKSNTLMHSAITPILGFTARKGGKDIDADLGLFYKPSSLRKGRIDLIFAECKTYNEFEKKDVDRMSLLADQFPSAIIVFSTLRKSLTPKEERMLRTVANKGRRYFKAERPFNPVMVLTGTELFADWRPPKCWQDAGMAVPPSYNRLARSELLRLCDATQQLYLGMEPWDDWLFKQYEKRREKIAKSRSKPQG